MTFEGEDFVNLVKELTINTHYATSVLHISKFQIANYIILALVNRSLKQLNFHFADHHWSKAT